MKISDNLSSRRPETPGACLRHRGNRPQAGVARERGAAYIWFDMRDFLKTTSVYRAAAALICAVVCVASTPAAAREIVGQGDFMFYLDTASFMGQQDRVLEEVYVRIPNNEIKFKEGKHGWESRVKLSVLINDLNGKAVIEDAKEMTFNEEREERARTSAYFQTVIKRYQLEPGTYELSYAIEDLNAEKVSITGLLSQQNKTSAVRRMRITLPVFTEGEASFSDAKFVWEVDRSGGRLEYHPNPSHLYGLYRDTVMVYMELYLPDSMATSPTFEFRSQLVSGGSEIVAETRVDLPNPGDAYATNGVRIYPVLMRQDLSRVLAGTYSMWVSFGLDGRMLRRVRCGDFSVAWDLRTWEVPRREYLAEARFLLGDAEFLNFQQLDIGEQEKRLDRMWKQHDPTPETAENESYSTFLVRLAFINQHYREGGRPAVFSARGQLYLRYGPPDELLEDVIPINEETVQEAIETVSDKYHPINLSSHSVKPYASPSSRSVVTDPRDLGRDREGDHTSFAFELWVYHTAGDPILERDRTKEADIGMRYLFTDRQGYGIYKMESSSSITNK